MFLDFIRLLESVEAQWNTKSVKAENSQAPLGQDSCNAQNQKDNSKLQCRFQPESMAQLPRPCLVSVDLEDGRSIVIGNLKLAREIVEACCGTTSCTKRAIGPRFEIRRPWRES
jgi:hypothetical protein